MLPIVGTLEVIPCSHVGHIFRKKSPYQWRPDVDAYKRNRMRLAEVWTDEYKKYFYARTGKDDIDIGDISERVQLRKDLKCISFHEYLKKYYPEINIPSESMSYGEVRNC